MERKYIAALAELGVASSRLLDIMGPCEAVENDLKFYSELRPDYLAGHSRAIYIYIHICVYMLPSGSMLC